MTNELRRRRPAPRGKTAAIVLLVLAAVCVIVALAGGYFFYRGSTDAIAILSNVAAPTSPALIPGSGTPVTVQGGPGAILVVARANDTVDGTAYTYPPSNRPQVTVTDEKGNSVRSANNSQGRDQGPFPLADGGGAFFVDVFPVEQSGTFTVAATGDPTALRVKLLAGPEGQQALGVLRDFVVGAFSGCCGCGGAAVFGLIGLVLILFGRKAPAA